MHFLPYISLTIETDLDPAEAKQRLNNHVRQKSFLPSFSHRFKFYGDATDSGFIIKPVIPEQQIFMPEYHGSFSENEGRTLVEIQVVPNTTIMAIVTIQFAALCVLIFTDGWRMAVTAAGSVILAWFLSMCGFWLDGGISMRRLRNLFVTGSKEETRAGYTPPRSSAE